MKTAYSKLINRVKSVPKRFISAIAVLLVMGLQPATTREIRTFSFVVTGGELVAGEKVVRVLKGDRVELVWQSDQQVEVHLHGYDKLLPVRTGEPGRMTIDAQTTGRFPISIHTGQGHGHAPVAYFEVHPR